MREDIPCLQATQVETGCSQESATTTTEDLGALLPRIRQGDQAAQMALMEKYAGVIQRTARFMLGHLLRPHLDSVDLVQSVHRTLLIGLRNNKFDITSPEKLIALALTLMRRKVARNWRKLKHQPGLVRCQATDTLAARAHISAGSRQPDPAQEALLHDEWDHLLQNLEEIDCQLLRLRLQGFSTAEVARQLQLDPGFLRVRLGRLRKRLSDNGLLADWI